ncbi:hypothetical protein V6N11_079431 [Hibiscus sabdariffa]|uniref:Uncharacterized protein n=1 Tax=Hibiscus sabdariffa TaxID=183260 RepID=A0ABR2RW20_9ROSI
MNLNCEGMIVLFGLEAGIYCCCVLVPRKTCFILGFSLWEELGPCPMVDRKGEAKTNDSEPWCILGDSNIVCSQDEKTSGNAYDAHQAAPFQNMMDKCGLLEMPITGGAFTWSNMRTNDNTILKKIDRILFHVKWSLLFNKAPSFVEPAIGSDHNPIVLQLEGRPRKYKRDFKFELKWLLEEECNRVVTETWDKMGHRSIEVKLHGKLRNSRLKLLSLSKNKFGMDRKTTEGILKKIAHLQSAPLTMGIATVFQDSSGSIIDGAIEGFLRLRSPLQRH